VQTVWKSETGEASLVGKQSLLHEPVFLLRGEEVPKHDRLGCCIRSDTGLACGQGIGEGVHAGTTATRRDTGTEGGRH
jgi:hypothetical protein